VSPALPASAEEALRIGEAAAQATVLIVDNEAQNRRLLETLLRPEGYRTVSVASGEAALASIARHAPDLILLDLMMPGMDGCQLAALLKADRATANIPIIMVTQALDRSARLAALEAGVEDFLMTPVDRAELWLRVRNLLRLKALGAFFRNHNTILDQQSKQAEDRLRRLNRVHAVHSQISSLIVRVRGRAELFREACHIAVAEGGFLLARVIQFEADGKASIAASTEADSRLFQRIVDEYNANPAQSQSMLALALRGAQPLVANDVANDPRIPNRAALTREGTYALAVLPILVEKRVVGALILRAREKDMFDADELRLLLDLVSNLAFALELMDKRERIDYLAYYDALTGLANRTLFLERLAQYMRSAASGGHQLAVFLVDLERFKNINDTLGRAAGDALLKLVAEWLTRNTGDANLVARVGADQFALMLPEVRRAAGVARLLEKTMAAFLEHPFRLDDAVLRIPTKVGVALYPEDGASADALLRNAEAALKKAKAGGDRYLFYTEKMTETVAGRLTLENQLRQALEKGEFVLHYQPLVSLASGKLTGAEALIRWNDPRTGLVPPGQFIPVLEETGLITEVGRWALREAVSDHLRWRTAGLPAVRISVNVSPLQLRNRAFVEEVRAAIGVDPRAAAGLELEITESLIMEDVKHSIASLQAIRALGVKIAIDDFGTGFSSLSYLAKLPVDTLKIDRSFVTDMTSAPEGLSLVSTIINLAHALKLKVVAEGVETEEQSRLLRLLDCDEFQGFLYSKPVPRDAFEANFLVRAL
jgi:diguanylate cyclase (GGDEF)-like protein